MSVEPDKPAIAPTQSVAQATLYREVALLAAESASRNEYFSRVLKHVARSFASPYAAIYARSNTEVFEDYWHQGNTDPKFWKPVVHDALNAVISSGQPSARLLSARQATLTLGLITVPLLTADGESIGALAVVAKMTEDETRESLPAVESVVALMMHAAQTLGQSPAPGPTRLPEASGGLAKAAGYDSSEELAFSLTASLRTSIGCQQVALGFVLGWRVRILAISGQEEVRGRTPGTLAIRQAMEECLDEGGPLVAQERARTATAVASDGHRLHRQWHYQARNAAVVSVPMKLEDRTVAVVSLQLRHGTEVTEELIKQVTDAVQPFVPILVLLEQARRGVVRHVWESARASVQQLFAPGRYMRKAAAVGVAVLAGWLLFGSMNYQVKVTASVRPAQLRHIGMPYDAALDAVEKLPGDHVAAGEVVCRLDARELELQRAQLAAELAVAEQETRRAMAVRTPVDTRLAEMEANVIRVRLATVESRIDRAAIRSPIDGIVVEGDLRTRIGSVMPQGTALIQVAPDNDWRLELHVPDHACSDVHPGLAGRFASHARPDSTQPFRLNLVQPNAVPGERQTVFIAEAELDNAQPWLRPGMEGVAKITVGRRAVWWVLFHSVIDYLRVSLWL